MTEDNFNKTVKGVVIEIPINDIREILGKSTSGMFNLNDYMKDHFQNVHEVKDEPLRVDANNTPADTALGAVGEYIDRINKEEDREIYDPEFEDSMHVTWFAYVAGNWKAMVMSEGFTEYFEVTYISEENSVKVDAYDINTESRTFKLEIEKDWMDDCE